MAKHRKPRLGPRASAENVDPRTGVVLLPALDDAPAGDEWGFKRMSSGFALDLDPAPMVDAASRAVLTHARTSILEGKRPDTGGPQRPLSRRTLRDPDRQSEHRGYRTGLLADGIRRSNLTSDGQTATATIVGPPERNAFLGKEKAKGVNLLTLSGLSGEAAKAAVAEVVAVVATGRKVEADVSGVGAKDA